MRLQEISQKYEGFFYGLFNLKFNYLMRQLLMTIYIRNGVDKTIQF